MLHDLHFLNLNVFTNIHSFQLALSSEAISIDELGSIAPKRLYDILLTQVCFL